MCNINNNLINRWGNKLKFGWKTYKFKKNFKKSNFLKNFEKSVDL